MVKRHRIPHYKAARQHGTTHDTDTGWIDSVKLHNKINAQRQRQTTQKRNKTKHRSVALVAAAALDPLTTTDY